MEIALSKYCGPDDILTPINFDEDLHSDVSSLKAQNYAKSLAKHRLSDVFRRVSRASSLRSTPST